MNDLPESISYPAIAVIFADDTTISNSSPWQDAKSLCDDLSTCTRDLEHWIENNRLQLNVSKTKTMLITGKRLKGKLSPDDQILNITTKTGENLQQDYSYKLLGVILDEGLNFNDHIDMLCKNCQRGLGFLRSIHHYLLLKE